MLWFVTQLSGRPILRSGMYMCASDLPSQNTIVSYLDLPLALLAALNY